MKKTAFIMGSIELILGFLSLIATSVLHELIPKLGYAVFMACASGTYTPGDYHMDFTVPNAAAILLCAAGAASIAYACLLRKE